VATTTSATAATASNTHVKKYSRYLSSQEDATDPDAIGGIMNGAIKQKLKVIPTNLTWQELSEPVYKALIDEIMKPRIDEVGEHSLAQDQQMEFRYVFLKCHKMDGVGRIFMQRASLHLFVFLNRWRLAN
jgi:hypothetical protein